MPAYKDDAAYCKAQMKPLVGYTLSDVIVKNGGDYRYLRLVFTKGGEAAGVDILCDAEGNDAGWTSVFHA